MFQLGLSKDRQVEELLELILEKTLKTKELINLLVEKRVGMQDAKDLDKLTSWKEEIEDLTYFALENKLIEQLGEKLKISKTGEKFLFSSKIYAR